MTKKMNIPFSPPDITEAEINEVVDTLKSGWITTGPKTKKLEKEMADFCNVNRGACLNSATAGLEIALRLFEIGEGDEVIVPAYTYTASASVVCHVGATLKLIDCGKDSYELDYDAIAEMITSRTKAIIPVDIAGVMVDYDKIFEIVSAKKEIFEPKGELQKALGRVAVISDSAHGYGASRLGKMSGEYADFTSFSFHAVKNFTTAEGGGLVWKDIQGVDNEKIYKQIMLFSLHGQNKDALAKTKLGAWEYDIIGTYYKCNMTDIMAAMGLAQMKRYPGMLQRRKEMIAKYTQELAAEDVQVIEHFNDTVSSSGHLMLVRLLGKDVDYRNEFIIKMAEAGVATNVHYKPLPMHTAYKQLGFDISDFPNAYDMYRNEITLPLHTCLTDEQLDYIIATFKEVKEQLG